MTRDEVCRLLDVSRETSRRLDAYVALLLEWRERMNLIGPGEDGHVWHRHVLDCGQIARFVPRHCGSLFDLGSGAGLPGLVLAILGVPGVELVESDRKKAAFLRLAAETVGVDVTVRACRAEDLDCPPAEVVTARALAPLERLVPMAHRIMAPASVAIFPKGRGVDAELAAVTRLWHLWYARKASLTDTQGCLLVIDRMHDDARR